ncbi:MAG TPA: bifunctional molybdenum cofactor biosynthesis protein MoaC/MoaB [Nitrososphaeraceae archaeon]|nr:bifunctional molybdenum cofactor biosynthesis protein MoaC/MoaB [Nitrososphaeraceae archaeon]
MVKEVMSGRRDGRGEGGGMFDVADKSDTLRLATAQAVVRISPLTSKLIKEGKSPKGNIFDAARIAATMAAKRTSDLIPYCHPIPIDDVKVDVLLKNDYFIEIKVQVKTVWKTGVEMESLTAACVASLTIYDMLKPIDESLTIESVKLLEKHGGTKDFHERQVREFKAAVLVTSDSRGEKEDKSGKIIIDKLKENGFDIIEYKVIADDINTIESELKRFCDELKPDVVVTSGGTGVGPRDNTPDATKKIIQKELTGISETLRSYGQRRTPLSMLSRGIAGVRGRTLIVNLPGSTKAVSQSLNSMFPGILHIFNMLEGKGH